MGKILQLISGKVIIISLLFFILFELVFIAFKAGIITVKINSPKKDTHVEKQVQSVSTSSAVVNVKKSVEVPGEKYTDQPIPQANPGEISVSCVVDPNCGGGEKILPLSVCENTACCFENGRYIQYWDRKSCGGAVGEAQGLDSSQDSIYVPVVTHESYIPESSSFYISVYLEAFNTTYSCNANAIDRIRQADSEYIREFKEVAEICARSDASYYGTCLSSCVQSEELETCDKECYEQSYGRCSINPVDSPEYRHLESIMGTHCK